MKKPSADELETMRDARTASLIRRWLAGKKLTDEEKIEVSQNAGISLDVLVAGPSAPGAKEAVKGKLDTRKHVKWAKKLPEYAKDFGQTDRTVKRWIRRGKETRELPPLDHPWKMPAWWRRNMDHQVPDYLLGFKTPESEPPDPHSGSNDTPPLGDKSGDGRSSRDFSEVKGLDIAENVAALRRTHAINKQLLDEALHADPPNDSAVQLRQKNFERSFELLRKGEQTLIELQKQRGDLVDREKVRGELAQVFESLRLMRETMVDRIFIELEKILPVRLHKLLNRFKDWARPAVEKARADEENIFRNLDTLRGPEDVAKLLAA